MTDMLTTPGGLLLPSGSAGYAYDPDGSMTWLKRFEKKMSWRNQRTSIYDAYYRGHHKLQFATPKFRTTFGGLFSEFADNWMPLIVDAVSERLNPQGFRLGTDSDKGDKDAWYMWQANGLDSQIKMGFTEALMREESYLLVWDNRDPDAPTMPDSGVKVPRITVEDPSQMVVAYSNEVRGKIVAAAKFFVDDDGYPCATVYLPKFIYKYRSLTVDPRSSDMYQNQVAWLSSRPAGGGTQDIDIGSVLPGNPTAITPVSGDSHTWHPREVVDANGRPEPWPLPNPLNRVPVVPLRNRARLLGEPESEIHHAIPLQDAVNKFVTDLLLASEFAAFQQRWVTGLEKPVDKDGRDMPIPSGPGTIMWTKNHEAKFGQFPELSGEVHIKAVEMMVQHIASQSRTPPHYFYLSGQFPSGESIKSAETGLVAKVRDKMVSFGESLEEAIRMGFMVMDDDRGKRMDSETIWHDPESRTESEHVDATIKRIAIGVPLRQLQEDVGYSQAQIDRFRMMRMDEIQDYILAEAMALQKMAAAGIPIPGQTPDGTGAGGTPGAGGAPIGLPSPLTNGARDQYIASPGSPAAMDIRGTRQTL